jgi:hypothetical protein
VAIFVGAFFTTELCGNSDVVRLGLCAFAAEVAPWVGNQGIACVVLAPAANAVDWAAWLLADCFLGFSIRWSVLALSTTMLGRGDLDPLAVLHDGSHTIRAAGIAVSILAPLADCRNWARNWLWITKLNLHLILITAFLATMHSFLGDNEVTSLGAIRVPSVHSMSSALSRAILPLSPIAHASYWARVLVASIVLDVSRLVLAFLSTMKCFLSHNEDGLCLTTSTVAAAL